MLLVAFHLGLQVLRVSLNVFFLDLMFILGLLWSKGRELNLCHKSPMGEIQDLISRQLVKRFALLEKITIILSLTIHYSNFLQAN